MAKQVIDIEILQQYLEGVMGRSGHHADEVREIVLALVGAVIWKKNGIPIEVKEYDGEPANILWWHSQNGNKYAFNYDHKNKNIKLHQRTFRGEVLATFDNDTPIKEIIELFETL